MKAIVMNAYGGPDVLKVGEVDKPSPKDNEVLIKIKATTATLGDCETRSLNLPLMVALPMRIWLGRRKRRYIARLISGESWVPRSSAR